MNNLTTKGESLVYDIIKFLKEWALWQDILIFYNGKKYSDFVWDEDDAEVIKGFCDMEDVYITDNENPADYLGADLAEIGEELSSVCVVNETLLSNIIMRGYYEAEWDKIGPEARAYLLDVKGGNLLVEEFEEEMQYDLYMERVKKLEGETIHCTGYPVVDHIIEGWQMLSAKYGVADILIFV